MSKLRVTDLCAGNSPVTSPHKGPVTQKMFPLNDVIMTFCIMSSLASSFSDTNFGHHNLLSFIQIQPPLLYYFMIMNTSACYTDAYLSVVDAMICQNLIRLHEEFSVLFSIFLWCEKPYLRYGAFYSPTFMVTALLFQPCLSCTNIGPHNNYVLCHYIICNPSVLDQTRNRLQF